MTCLSSKRVNRIAQCVALLAVGLLVGVVLAQSIDDQLKKPAATDDGVSVYFSPDGKTMNTLIHLIDSARKSISVQIYYFTHDDLADALIRAQKRGVEVDIVWDHGGATLKDTPRIRIRRAGIPVYVFKNDDAIMHNKVILIDSQVIITGSMNFTWSGDNANVENTLIIRNRPKLVAAYEKRHSQLQRISKKYE